MSFVLFLKAKEHVKLDKFQCSK